MLKFPEKKCNTEAENRAFNKQWDSDPCIWEVLNSNLGWDTSYPEVLIGLKLT